MWMYTVCGSCGRFTCLWREGTYPSQTAQACGGGWAAASIMQTRTWGDSAGAREVGPAGFQPRWLRLTNCLFTFAHKQQQIKVGLVWALFGDVVPGTGLPIRPLYTRQS